jgi:hypothetical protein
MKEEVMQIPNQNQQQIVYIMEVFDNTRILFINTTNELLITFERINLSTQDSRGNQVENQ